VHEPNLWRQLNHPNIVRYIDHFPHEDDLVVVMEYIERIPLNKKLIKIAHQSGKRFSEKSICSIFSQLVSALNYYHSLQIIQ
jgi:NIMA (never in mitosis gene a)-related kinase